MNGPLLSYDVVPFLPIGVRSTDFRSTRMFQDRLGRFIRSGGQRLAGNRSLETGLFGPEQRPAQSVYRSDAVAVNRKFVLSLIVWCFACLEYLRIFEHRRRVVSSVVSRQGRGARGGRGTFLRFSGVAQLHDRKPASVRVRRGHLVVVKVVNADVVVVVVVVVDGGGGDVISVMYLENK